MLKKISAINNANISAQPLRCQPLRGNLSFNSKLGSRLDVCCDKAQKNGNIGNKLNFLA